MGLFEVEKVCSLCVRGLAVWGRRFVCDKKGGLVVIIIIRLVL